MNLPKTPRLFPKTKLDKTKLYFIASGCVSLILIFLSIVIPTGILSSTYNKVYNSLYKPQFQPIREISDYTSPIAIIQSQPSVSYKDNIEFVLVETGEYNCEDCKVYKQYVFDNIFNDFIKKRKTSYVWVDSNNKSDIRLHVSAYCAAEQKADVFFEFQKTIFNNDVSNSVNLIQELKLIAQEYSLDTSVFESCINSNKYKARVENLSFFAQNELSPTSSHGLYLFAIKKHPVRVVDKIEEQSFALLTHTVDTSASYKDVIVPDLKKALDQ
jgi:hypothetical protein